jgi:hypothetical protein
MGITAHKDILNYGTSQSTDADYMFNLKQGTVSIARAMPPTHASHSAQRWLGQHLLGKLPLPLNTCWLWGKAQATILSLCHLDGVACLSSPTPPLVLTRTPSGHMHALAAVLCPCFFFLNLGSLHA